MLCSRTKHAPCTNVSVRHPRLTLHPFPVCIDVFTNVLFVACPRTRGKDISNIEEAYAREKQEKEEEQQQPQELNNDSTTDGNTNETPATAATKNDVSRPEAAVVDEAAAAAGVAAEEENDDVSKENVGPLRPEPVMQAIR